MACVQSNAFITKWNIPTVITYPTPPYMSVRIYVGFRPDPPPVTTRELMDMIKKYSPGEEITLLWPDKKPEFERDIFRKNTNGIQKSSIRDVAFKYMVYNRVSGLMAMKTQTSQKKAIFEITNYDNPSGGKKPVTLRLNEQDLYLSCNQSGQLVLEEKKNIGTLEQIEGATKRFLFLRTGPSDVTFESMVSTGMFLSTSSSDSQSSVTVSSSSDPKRIISFQIEKEAGAFIFIGNRIALKIPLRILERLQELDNNQQMFNIYEGFTDRNSVCW